MEYWFKQPEVIRKIASHYATNMPMPETMIKRVCAMLNEFEALHTVEQISYSMFDLTINSSTEEKPDIEGIHRELSKEVGLLDYGGVSVCPAVVADRYAGRRCSKYYGHLWAKVFAADLFKSRFLKDGIDNAQTWMEYRKT
ncbi:metalloendopeptidase, partial [Coemansia sp. RSA 2399]